MMAGHAELSNFVISSETGYEYAYGVDDLSLRSFDVEGEEDKIRGYTLRLDSKHKK